jgi:hypothetical protein
LGNHGFLIHFLGLGQFGELLRFILHLLLEALDALLGVFKDGFERGALVVRQVDLVMVFSDEIGRKESLDRRLDRAAMADGQEKEKSGAQRDERGRVVA